MSPQSHAQQRLRCLYRRLLGRPPHALPRGVRQLWTLEPLPPRMLFTQAAPINVMPPPQSIAPDTSAVFSTLNGNAITLTDVDAGNSLLIVSLSVSAGKLSVAGTTGLTFTTGDGAADGAMTFKATLANANAALNGLTFVPPASFTGVATLAVTTNDQDNSGPGGPGIDTDSVAINVATPATNVALTSVQDAYVQLGNPTANTGAAGSMVVDRAAADLRRALMQFDLSSIPAGSTITSAALKLQSTQIGGALTINAYQLLEAWNEAAVTWNDRLSGVSWIAAGGSSNGAPVASITKSSTGEHAFDITSVVQSWVSGSMQNHGVLIGSPDGGGNRTVTYDTREGAVAPVLEITYAAPVNSAPVLDSSKSPALASVNEDAAAPSGPVGTLLSTLLDFASPTGQVDNVTDSDANAQLGIAITAADTASGAWFYSTDNGANWTALGAVSSSSARLLPADANTRIYFRPNANFTGAVSPAITFRAWDQASGAAGTVADVTISGGTTAFSAAADSASIAVTAVNDAPVNSVPAAQSMTEDATLTFSAANANAIVIADVDAGSGLMKVTLAISDGVLTLAGNSGLSFSAGDGAADSSMTFTAALSAINAALDGLTFVPPANYNGGATLSISADDQGNSGTGGAKGDSDSVAITINAINDAPVNHLPPDQNSLEGGLLVFSSAAGNGVSVSDVDAGSSPLRVTLTPNVGTISLGSTTGLTFTVGNGATDSTMTFTGTAAAINNALEGLTWQPPLLYFGPGSITMTTSDLGSAGAGGALSDTDVIGASVSPVNDPPVNNVPGAQAINEDANLLFSAGLGNGISVNDPDVGSSELQITLNAARGTLSLGQTTGLTFTTGDGSNDNWLSFLGTLNDVNQALNGLIYTPDSDFSGADTLKIWTDDQGNTGSGGSQVAASQIDIAINAVNDAPIAQVPAAQSISENASIVFSAANGNAITISDVDAGASPLRVTIAPATGTITLATTSGLTFLSGDGTGDASLAFTGTLNKINAALDGMIFKSTSGVSGGAAVAFVVSDLGNSGAGGDKTDSETVGITVAAVNDAPVNVLPPLQTINEDSTLTFSSANGNAIVITDSDAGAADLLRVTLTAAHGSVTLASVAGLTFVAGDGVADDTLTFDGTLADLNAALDGLVFTPGPDFAGSARIRINTDDLGHSPAPALIDNDAVDIIFAPVNDAPTSTGIPDVNVNEDAPPTVLAPAGFFADVDDSTLDLSLISNTNASLFDSVSLDVGTGQLTLSYAANAFGSAALTIRATDGSGLFIDVTFNVNVNAVNDAPLLAANSTLTLDEGASALITDTLLKLADIDNIPGDLSFTLTALPQKGVLALNGNPLGVGESFTQTDVDAGRVSYGSTTGHSGADSFAFTASDGSGGSIGATSFSIAVDAAPPPPPPPPPISPSPPPPPPASPPPAPAPPIPPPPPATDPTHSDGPALPPAPTINPTTPQAELPLDELPTDESTVETPVSTLPLPLIPQHHGGASASGTTTAGGAGGAADAAGPAPLIPPPPAENLQPDAAPAQPVAVPALPAPLPVADVPLSAPIRIAPPPAPAPPIVAIPVFSAQEVAFVSAPAGQFARELDALEEKLTGQMDFNRLVAGTASFVSLGASVLYILWTIRAGYLVASLLSSMPAWQFVDPLPILNDPNLLDRRRREGAGGDDDDESLETLVEQSNAPAGAVS